MLDRLRECQGDDQLDLFPEVTKRGGFYGRLATAIAVVLAVCLIAYSATAEEKTGTMLMTKGLICDTEAQVIEFVDKLAETEQTPQIDGCGYVAQPVFVTWEVINTHENARATVVIAKFQSGTFTQFGIQAWTPKAEVKPVGDSI